ncbi:hypothetical protein PFISCL1PPCAC_6660, partial [Pristionchus fissidentatus]
DANRELSEEIKTQKEKKLEDESNLEVDGRKRRKVGEEGEFDVNVLHQLSIERNHYAAENDRLRAMIKWYTGDATFVDTTDRTPRPISRLQWRNAPSSKSESTTSLPSIDIPKIETE